MAAYRDDTDKFGRKGARGASRSITQEAKVWLVSLSLTGLATAYCWLVLVHLIVAH